MEDNSFPEEIWSNRSMDDWGQGFWGETRVRVVLEFLNIESISDLLDVGSGTGLLMSVPLARAGIEVTCVEPLLSGAAVSRAQGIKTFATTLADAPIESGSVDAIGLFDVLEDAADSQALLSDVFDALRPGGVLIATVPGHTWLFSDYDEAVGTRRRYSRSALREALIAGGFQVSRAHGLFGFLVPYAFVSRRLPFLLGRRRTLPEHGRLAARAAHLPRFLDHFLRNWALLEYRLALPWGLSMIAFAQKPSKSIDGSAA